MRRALILLVTAIVAMAATALIQFATNLLK
jgi:hypothetical protein